MDIVWNDQTDSDGEPWTDDVGIVWQPRTHRHIHPMPPAGDYPFGSIARCVVCHSLFVREATSYLIYPVRATWRQLGWFGVTWRRLLGRIPNRSAKPADTTEGG